MIKCGIDIGGTNIKVGFFEDDKKIGFYKCKTPSEKELIVKTIKDLITANYDLKDILGYTVAIPGVLENDIVAYAPNTNILGLRLKDMLREELENDNIIIENDANLQALAESIATNTKDLILFTIGTGLGGGIIIDGKLHNKNGYAGEIGHIKVHFGPSARVCGCHKRGCAEAYVSCKAIVKEYNQIKGVNINSKTLFDLAKKNDMLAIKSIKECARYLAITIADVVSVLGIKNIRIAGGLSNAGEMFLNYVRKYYPQYSVLNMENVSISRAYLKYEAGIYAAKYLL